MSIRAAFFVLALLACAVGGAASPFAQTSQPAQRGAAAPGAVLTPIEFFLAHGEPGACGPGCNEWIAAEGKIDLGAADRLRQLLKKLKDRRPPIYFHSPGGRLNDALELGRLIRDRKFEVSVGHTVPLGCDSAKQSDNSCAARKRAGEAIEAEISPTVAQCNSGCVYALAGGVVRQVPPWVSLGIHDAGLDPNSKVPPGASVAMAMRLFHARLRSYLREMGIDDALYSASLATPFESVKLLQRDDLVRLGIDRREFGETPWQFVDRSPSEIAKRFFVRTDGDRPRYVDGMIEAGCSTGPGMVLVFKRQRLESDTENSIASATNAISITIKGQQISLTRTVTSAYYFRTGLVGLNALDKIGDDLTIELPGTELGRRELGNITLNTDGFAAAYAKLRPHCSTGPREPKNVSAADAQAAMRVVSQLPRTTAVVSDPQTAAWLQSKGAAPGAQAAAATDAAAKPWQTLELTRVATAEQKLRLDFLYYLWGNCAFAGLPTVRVAEQPQHGEISIEDGVGSPNFPSNDPNASCNRRPARGLFIFYQPSVDYRGVESITLSVVSPSGDSTTRHYSIEVK